MSEAAPPAAGPEALDFSPAILRLQRDPPSPLPRLFLYLLGWRCSPGCWSGP